MKTNPLILLLFGSIFLLSCASKPEDAVIGKWNEVGGAGILEFFKEGTVTINSKHRRPDGSTIPTIWGNYKFLEPSRLKVEFTKPELPGRTLTYMIRFSKDSASATTVLCAADEMTERGGSEVKYQKEGSAGTNDIAPCKAGAK